MNQTPSSLAEYFDSASRSLLKACTACGACVTACPVVPTAGIESEPPEAVIGGVLELLRGGGPLEGASRIFAGQCNGCGECIPACPEGINPRRLVMLASTMASRQAAETPHLFRRMARAIRIMAAMQLAPDELSRLLRPPSPRPVDVVFYLGCNPIRTPHLLFNAMTVLDALEVDYEVVGGPAACCGIIHAKWQGDFARGEKVTEGSLDRFAGFSPDKVLSWCPSCILHLGETVAGFRDPGFDFGHVTSYFVDRLDELKAHFNTPIPRRAVLHTHVGMAEYGENVERLLAAIPGLEIVEIMAEPGYTCGGSGADRSPALKAMARDDLLRRIARDDVDLLITLYHGCHGQLVSLQARGEVEVLNFTDLLVEALGEAPREDRSKHLRMMDDWRLVLEEGAPWLKANGIDVDPEWLRGLLPDIFAQAEFKGGLEGLDGSSVSAS